MKTNSSQEQYSLPGSGNSFRTYDRRQFLKITGGGTLAAAITLSPNTAMAHVGTSGSGNYVDYIDIIVNPSSDLEASGAGKSDKGLALLDALRELDKKIGAGITATVYYFQSSSPTYVGDWNPAVPEAPTGGGGSAPKIEVSYTGTSPNIVATVKVKKEPTASYTGKFNVYD